MAHPRQDEHNAGVTTLLPDNHEAPEARDPHATPDARDRNTAPDAPLKPATSDDSEHDLLDLVERMMHRRLGDHLAQVEHTMARHVREAVDGGRRHLDVAVQACTPAWLRPTAGEPRWPVMIAVLVAIGLQLSIPGKYAIQPQWLLPLLEGTLLVVLTAANPKRINTDRQWVRVLSLVLVALGSLATAYSALRLVVQLVTGRETSDAPVLLLIGGAIWLTNVIIFALWYWEFDRGGPGARAHAKNAYADFQFPQMATPDTTHPDWEPTFVDYLYLSFTNATACSPTDTVPMTRWAKMLMLSQSLISLATVALAIARAVNVLK